MPTPITVTKKDFTFNIADQLYAKTNDLKRTASATYEGPDKVWIFVDKDTGKISRMSPPLTSQEDGDSVPVPQGTVRVEVSAEHDIVVLAMLKEDSVVYANTDAQTDSLPNGGFFTYNVCATLGQTYDLDSLYYDTENKTWNGFDFIDSNITWEDVINHRNSALTSSDGKISPDMPEEIKQPWIEFRQALRDLPATFGYGTDNEIEAWKVEFPQSPE